MILYIEYVNAAYKNILEDFKQEILEQVLLSKSDMKSVDYDFNDNTTQLIIDNINANISRIHNFSLEFNYIDNIWTVNCNYKGNVGSNIVLNEVVFEIEFKNDDIIISQDLISLGKNNRMGFLTEYLFCDQYNAITTFLEDFNYNIGIAAGLYCNSTGDFSISNGNSDDFGDSTYYSEDFSKKSKLLAKLSESSFELVNLILFENKKLTQEEIESYSLIYDIDFTPLNDFEFVMDIKKLKNKQTKKHTL